MNISVESHRMRIGLFSSNRPQKCIKPSATNPFITFKTFFILKLTTFFMNSLTVSPNIFILLLELVACILDSLDPIFNALVGLLVLIYAINAFQFLLIHSYVITAIFFQTSYDFFVFSAQFSQSDLFTKFFLYKMLEMLTHGDIEPHPGPPSPLKFMHWNLNSLPAHDFRRVSILQAYAVQEKLDLIDISESALKTKIDNEKIEIDGYSIFRNDLVNTQRCVWGGGVALQQKSFFCKKQA